MAATPYRAVSFSKGDTVTMDALDQIQSNYQWTKDNSPRGRFMTSNGNPIDSRIVIIAGKARIKRNKKSVTGKAVVRFGKAFDAACHPHVSTGIIATFQRRIHCTVGGIDRASYPNATGFEVYINIDASGAKNDKIDKDVWVAWSAFGFRGDDLIAF